MAPASSPPARSTTANDTGSAAVTKPTASSCRYGTGTAVQRWISGSWQIRYTSSASAGRHGRSVTSSPVSTGPLSRPRRAGFRATAVV